MTVQTPVKERSVSVIPPPKTIGMRSSDKKDVSVGRLTFPATSSSKRRNVPSTAVGGSAAALGKPFLWMIRLYQKTLSFDHGPLSLFFPYGYCRYEPSCSQYAYDAIKKRGILSGLLLGAWRILRCNPFSHGGVDTVPEKGFRRVGEES